MGWGGGTQLMELLIETFEATIGAVPDGKAILFWERLIAAFENDDWDCQTECLGKNAQWDKAYFMHHPYDDGYFNEGENPYRAGSEEYNKFEEGRQDRLREQE